MMLDVRTNIFLKMMQPLVLILVYIWIAPVMILAVIMSVYLAKDQLWALAAAGIVFLTAVFGRRDRESIIYRLYSFALIGAGIILIGYTFLPVPVSEIGTAENFVRGMLPPVLAGSLLIYAGILRKGGRLMASLVYWGAACAFIGCMVHSAYTDPNLPRSMLPADYDPRTHNAKISDNIGALIISDRTDYGTTGRSGLFHSVGEL